MRVLCHKSTLYAEHSADPRAARHAELSICWNAQHGNSECARIKIDALWPRHVGMLGSSSSLADKISASTPLRARIGAYRCISAISACTRPRPMLGAEIRGTRGASAPAYRSPRPGLRCRTAVHGGLVFDGRGAAYLYLVCGPVLAGNFNTYRSRCTRLLRLQICERRDSAGRRLSRPSSACDKARRGDKRRRQKEGAQEPSRSAGTPWQPAPPART